MRSRLRCAARSSPPGRAPNRASRAAAPPLIASRTQPVRQHRARSRRRVLRAYPQRRPIPLWRHYARRPGPDRASRSPASPTDLGELQRRGYQAARVRRIYRCRTVAESSRFISRRPRELRSRVPNGIWASRNSVPGYGSTCRAPADHAEARSLPSSSPIGTIGPCHLTGIRRQFRLATREARAPSGTNVSPARSGE